MKLLVHIIACVEARVRTQIHGYLDFLAGWENLTVKLTFQTKTALVSIKARGSYNDKMKSLCNYWGMVCKLADQLLIKLLPLAT